MNKKSFIALSILFLLLIVYALFRERHLVYMFGRQSEIKAELSCDESLWHYNAEEENVINSCITITGVVASMHSESDGDENIQLRPDPGYVHLLNIWNILGQWGNIAIEAICENPPSKKKFITACAGYKSAITLPRVGDHISVTGSYGTDKHGWAEIHPVAGVNNI